MLARAVKILSLLALIAWVDRKVFQRCGAAVLQGFDDWEAKVQPQAFQVLQALRAPAGSGPGTASG